MALPGMNNPDAAVSFAEDTTGLYPGLCDRFVASAYGVNIDAGGTPHSGYKNAWTHWNQTPAKLRNPGKGTPPVGALVYWNNSVGGGHGHVAIVTSIGKNGEPIITSTHANGGRPSEFALSTVMPGAYLGWATPYFQGKTAKLDPTNLGKAVADVTANPGGYTDEGTGTPADSGLPQNKLNKRGLAEESSISWDFVKSHPDVMDVFQKAITRGWNDGSAVGKQNFINALQKTTWYTENSEYARNYLYLKSRGGETFTEQERVAAEYVRKVALKMGVKLDDAQTRFFANQTLMNGWNVSGRESFLPQALSGDLSWTDNAGKTHAFTTDFINYDAGGPSATIATLKNTAMKNGVTYSDDWYRSKAKSIANGLSDINDSIAEIRKVAATQNPLFKDKIEAGMDLEDLASPYTSRMDSKLDRAAGTTKASDPWIKRAMGGVNAKGEPEAMSMWDLEKILKQHPEWEYTKEAHQEVGSLVGKIGAMMGFGGSY